MSSVKQNDMLSPMWRMKASGVTSKDFLNQKQQNKPMAFYKNMWRFGNDQDYKADQKRIAAEKAKIAADKKSKIPPPIKNDLTKEAEALHKKGHPTPVAQQDSGSEEETAAALEARDEAQGEASAEDTELAASVKPQFTEDQLKDLPMEALVEYAAALGVANTAQKKPRLINSILEKQQS